ncbi:uncharacterized protein LOC117603333 [Osmia lignaria lignaria]|uniref:uncharacterized protein LOC117603333 n=1 Tax=Osmia lignaria lignaria TaxID=1437193 RepID=UPI00402BBAF8
MRASVVLIFAIQVSVVSGKLTVLRGKEVTRRYTQSNRKLLCLSEDDGAGLIWNSNLNWSYSYYEFSDRGGNTDFQLLNEYRKGEIDCDFNSHDDCMSAWRSDWSLTNSKRTPMGPAFDRRWEGFREHNNFGTLNQYRLVDKLERSGAFVMSIRGSMDAYMLLCDDEDYETNFCYWIIIGGWNNTRSVIRKCAKGVPPPMTFPIEPTCAKIRSSYYSEILSPTEWRTFILVWNENTRSISLYDDTKLLMMYTDNEEYPRNRTSNYRQLRQSSKDMYEDAPVTHPNYNIFLASSKTMLFRFHIYTFLHTTYPAATLISPEMDLTSRNICIQMMVGLCKKCQMEIVLIDSENEEKGESLDTIKAPAGIGADGSTLDLAMWQYVQIKRTISSYIGKRGRIKLISDLEQRASSPLWAVADIRTCPPVGTLRYGKIEATQDYADGAYFWPNVTCQKLFYKENVVVNSALDARFDSDFEDPQCVDYMVGPYCSINCFYQLEQDTDCRGTVICDQNGCTCPPGFVGKNCRSNCDVGQYGHGCKQTCGWCKGNNCNFKTGHCKSGCDNSKRYNIPPFCKIGIDVLPPPDIDFLNETVVRAVVPVMEQYKLIPTTYRFIVQKEGEADTRFIGDYTEIGNDTIQMIGYTDDLEPGISYQISCILYTNDPVSIPGKWTNFTTRCTSTTNFQVKATNTSLTLRKHQKAVPNSCPDRWYDFIFQNVETQVQINKGILFKLPHEFGNLTPYTLYKITISKGKAVLFSREIQTLEGVPSQVQNIKKLLFPNGDVTLKWDPPRNLNGMITKYEAVFQIQRYIGCENRLVQPRKNNTISTSTAFTSITFSNLTPYAHYVAKIAACTSYCGLEETIEFSTPQTEIPTEKYTNLRVQNYTLMWDPPKDCTTISGPIIAKAIVKGVSIAVLNVSITKQTTKHFIDLNDELYGAETYEARIYAIRDYHEQHDESLYEKLVFTTPSKSPPPVRNLQILEIDALFGVMDLRWQEPEPPINGKIEYYTVRTCHSTCTVASKVRPTEQCSLWNKYICATVEIFHQHHFTSFVTVSAKNVNVSTPSVASSVPMNRDEIQPDAPKIITASALDNGIVNFTWSHPWRSGGRLVSFRIIVEIISSRLRIKIQRSQMLSFHKYSIDHYRSQYYKELHLLSSTTYKISIYAVTNTGLVGATDVTEVQTPSSMGFKKNSSSEVHQTSSTISLHIPAVLNDTRNSLTTVVVQGPRACEHYEKLNPYLSKKVGIEYYENVWRIYRFSTEKFAGKTFTIDYEPNEGAANCPLKPEESYVIVIIVQSEEESLDDQIITQTSSIRISDASKRHEAWLVPITIILLKAVLFYLYRRRKRRRSLQKVILRGEMALAYNNDNLEVKSISSSSKQPFTAMSTPSDKELLSRANTPQDDTTVFVNDANQREERSSLVKVKDFEDYVKQAIQSGLLETQYKTLRRGQTRPWDYGKLPENKSKNRYGDLIAYDENRVILDKLPDDPFSDYINASYIKSYKTEKCYIATQGPKPNTVIDFWRMIWQEEVLVICMLANITEGGKVKCEQYWPDIGKKKKYGEIIVFNARHTVFADFTFRTLHVSCGDEARKIEHLHYTTWPDHGVPLSTHSVATYLKKVLATPTGSGPMVVHCSAGAGRTGTIILCDICLRRIAVEGAIDVFAEVESIRSQRANMVDNIQQYRLAHLTLVECLFSISTSLPCDEHLPARIMELKKQLDVQRECLEKMTWQEQALRPSTSRVSLSERNLAKNRYPELASANFSRVYLKRYPATDEDSDYIAAVYVDGVRLQNQHLATQLPLPGTLSDFWRMVAEYKVELIVLLQPPDPKDTTCCPVVPSKEFKPVPFINVRSKEFIEYESYTSQKLVLINNLEKPVTEQHITILCSTEWRSGRDRDPPATRMLVTLWQAAEKISRGGPTAVLCHDGVTGSGLYLALSFLLERMAVERECDVCLAIRAIRRSRPDFVKSLEQMEYLYDAAITYLEYFETYANFS